jgi:hypothetical protein
VPTSLQDIFSADRTVSGRAKPARQEAPWQASPTSESLWEPGVGNEQIDVVVITMLRVQQTKPAVRRAEAARSRPWTTACGFKLANDGHDTRARQHYLGHKNIQHTVRYTELSPVREF